MLYFMLLDYQDNSEINQSEKENITKLLKKLVNHSFSYKLCWRRG